MAEAKTTLKMYYKDAASEDKIISFGNADPEAESTDIKALNTAILANKDIWDDQPTTAVKAELVTTSYREVDLSE